MAVKIFKPNPRGTGAIFNFEFGPAKKTETLNGELALYISSVLQASWDASNRTGSFKENAKNPEKTVSAKFSEFEVGGFINAIKRRVEFKGYHSTDNGHTTFAFTPSKDEATGEFKGFLFSIIKDNKQKFFVPITAGEVEVLLAYLDFGLKTLFSNRTKARIARSEKSVEQPRPAARKPQQAPQEEPTPQTEEDPFAEEAAPQEPQQEETTPAPDENPFG